MRTGAWVSDTTTGRIIAVSVAATVVLTILGALGAAIFMPPQRVYETRMVVGSRELSAQQVPYYSTATIALAETYARYVTEVSADGSANVTASVIAGTPVLRIQAAARDENHARASVEKATENLIAQVSAGGSENLERLSEAVEEATGDLARVDAEVASLGAGASQEDRVTLASEKRLAELRLEAASEVYRSSRASSLNPVTQLTVVQPAYPVTENLPRSALVGGISGAILGGLLCLAWFTLRAKRPTTT